MNANQVSGNLVFYLNASNFVWPGGTSPVLGRASVTVNPPTFNTLDQVAPCVLIRCERTGANPEHPAALEEEARWTIVLYALNATDQAGQAAVLGGNRASLTTSPGRGLLEIEPLVRAQIWQAFLAAGVRPRITSAPATVPEALAGIMAARAYEVTATRFPVQPNYANVTRLLATTAGGATLTWTPVPLRWDLISYQVVRKAGATAPATPTDGTVVSSTVSPTATGYVDAGGGAGQSYSVFGVFDAGIDPWTQGRNTANPLLSYSGFWLPGTTLSGQAFTYRPVSVSL